MIVDYIGMAEWALSGKMCEETDNYH